MCRGLSTTVSTEIAKHTPHSAFISGILNSPLSLWFHRVSLFLKWLTCCLSICHSHGDARLAPCTVYDTVVWYSENGAADIFFYFFLFERIISLNGFNTEVSSVTFQALLGDKFQTYPLLFLSASTVKRAHM